MDSKKVLAKWLAILGEHYSKDITAANTAVYLAGLSDLSAQEIETCCTEALKTCRFMPTVADIRQHVKRVQQIEQSSECDREWGIVLDAVGLWDEGYQKWGMSGTPQLSSAGWYALRNCGGPSAVQRTKAEHLPLLKKTWDEAYSRNIEHEHLGLSDGQSKKLLAQVGESAKVKSLQ